MKRSGKNVWLQWSEKYNPQTFNRLKHILHRRFEEFLKGYELSTLVFCFRSCILTKKINLMNTKGKGRPATRTAKLIDGFYIEVMNKGQKERGIKIRSKTKAEMEDAARRYANSKDVVILGEYKNDAWVK